MIFTKALILSCAQRGPRPDGAWGRPSHLTGPLDPRAAPGPGEGSGASGVRGRHPKARGAGGGPPSKGRAAPPPGPAAAPGRPAPPPTDWWPSGRRMSYKHPPFSRTPTSLPPGLPNRFPPPIAENEERGVRHCWLFEKKKSARKLRFRCSA